MIPLVLSGLAIMRARRMAEASSSDHVWKEWELRAVVICSLALQIVLICLGKRRKYITGLWIRVATWSAYLLADTVAIYALGMISTMIGQINQNKLAGNMEPHAELSAFWAPFLLLHLGGPDTITANALEDNELWLRHLLALLNQAGITIYILFMSWTQTSLAIVSFVMMFPGLLKYGERIWALRAASHEQFKNSIADSRSRSSNKIVEIYQLKEAQGYDVIPHQVVEAREVRIPEALVKDLSFSELDSSHSYKDSYKRHQLELFAANSLVNTFQRLFADLLLSLDDRDTSLSLLQNEEQFPDAFKIIEIELALIYDLFYTKAKAIYSYGSFICRPISFFFICVALVVFSLRDKRQYSRTDLGVTFLLLGGAIFLEIYALFDLLFSDRAACWLINHKHLNILNVINWFRHWYRWLSRRRSWSDLISKRNQESFSTEEEKHRWSNLIGQCSLVNFSIKKENLPCRRFLKRLRVDKQVAKYLHVEGREELTKDLKNFIMCHLQEKAKQALELPSKWTDRGGCVLDTDKAFNDLKWSVELEFDISILVWHIATELCCHKPKPDGNSKMVMSDHLSRYMLFLLVRYPSMLPMGMGSIRFGDVYREASRFFKQHKSDEDGETNGKCVPRCLQWFRGTWCRPKRKDSRIDVEKACHILRADVKTKYNLSVTKEDKAKYVLFQGCRLAKQIEALKDEEKKWSVLSEVWVEMLFYAASRCKGRTHAQQMTRGGELITHVWLLMAHFGFTEHFQIPHAPAVAELVVSSK